MPIENTILLSNISAESSPSTFSYGEKKKAAGYHKINDGLHTAVYTVNSFSGIIKIQGTLNLYPGETDWFDIDNTEIGGDSSEIGGIDGQNLTISRNFIGNFLWIRAAYYLENGIIVDLRFSY
jgi:hypothetical protein